MSYPVTDRISAFVIFLIVLQSGYGIFRDSVKSLLDASVDKTTLDRIRTILKGFPAVKEVVSLNARNSGRFIFMAANIRLSSKKLKEAHAIADGIESEIKREIPFMERVIIHYEPEKKEYRRYAAPLQNMEGGISEHFGAAQFIGLWDERVKDEMVENLKILKNPSAGAEKGKGMELAQFLIEQEVDVLYIKKRFEGKGPEYLLSDAAIEVRITDLKSMNDLIELKRETAPKE